MNENCEAQRINTSKIQCVVEENQKAGCAVNGLQAFRLNGQSVL